MVFIEKKKQTKKTNLLETWHETFDGKATLIWKETDITCFTSAVAVHWESTLHEECHIKITINHLISPTSACICVYSKHTLYIHPQN